ncbi:hypothetical protein H257_06063 [Aphanomyces astaci]|uniref:EF-hand domain-containing protein n=1 Tax=Aphanomyces astaci TaxID=112090 RepID=W4GPI2_APHAT|nr:hypothetical protein H257_06063 [Aphanomyces astaci]ETV81597.1 hypothetical protein H257_06063 [Aphanomyces astaci]RQM21228.1 hypothetical protein B5M09_008770 [Aphanomyces astaci]|eukprot:XP_009829455.1 hypothetical protein H257_06063 [Aphanomyces astaci]
MDTDENGFVDLGEVVEYYRVEKEAKIAQIRHAADEAVTAVNAKYSRYFDCVTQGYQAVVQSRDISSADELQQVLQWADNECSKTTPQPTSPSDTYTRQEIVQYVQNITHSQQYIQCTEAVLDKFPEGYKFTKKDVDSIALTVQTNCLVATTPTPASPSPTRQAPTKAEILTYAKAVLEVLNNETEPVSNVQLHAFVKAHENVMTMKITKVWYNSDTDRQQALDFVTKFYQRVDKCLDAAVVVFGDNGTIAVATLPSVYAWASGICVSDSSKDFVDADLNKNNVVDEFEVAQVIATARNQQLSQLKRTTNSSEYLRSFFSIRETYDHTLECAHEGISQVGNAVDRTLTREQFYGYEAWMTRSCSNVVPDVSLHGVPSAVDIQGAWNLTTAHAIMGQLKAKDLELALASGTGVALHTQFIEDHYGLLRTCFDASFDESGGTPYNTTLERTRLCLDATVPSTMPIEVVVSRADFQALLQQLFAPTLAELDDEIAKAQAVVDGLRAKKAALQVCIRKAVDAVANGQATVRQRDLNTAQQWTNQCVASSPPKQ